MASRAIPAPVKALVVYVKMPTKTIALHLAVGASLQDVADAISRRDGLPADYFRISSAAAFVVAGLRGGCGSRLGSEAFCWDAFRPLRPSSSKTA